MQYMNMQWRVSERDTESENMSQKTINVEVVIIHFSC